MKIVTLKRQLDSMRMSETESVSQYSDRLMKIVNEIKILGKIVPEERLVEKVLVSVLEKFESKISSLEDSRDIKSMSMVDLISALEAQKQRRKMRNESGLEVAFQTKAMIKTKFQRNGKNSSKGKGDDCDQKKNQHQAQSSQSQQQQVNHAEDENEEELLFTALMADVQQQESSWFIDSGCTQHMNDKGEIFMHLEDMKGMVKLGNRDKVSIKGKGIIAVPTTKGIKSIIDVLLVPDLDQNLLSVGQLMQKGFRLEFADNKCEIKDPSGVEFMCVPMKNMSFAVNWSFMDVKAFSSKEENESLL
ncbi:uncharacterized protein LOC116137069 [Pistacia vera]|uniref:uncharacterized protein LOC116137069 n=1 Tax=Pistacia vera TaxID=55513 RepID=UPI00126396BD|nr:uncharacterized protein LOC116137069 [Pistacia vera]